MNDLVNEADDDAIDGDRIRRIGRFDDNRARGRFAGIAIGAGGGFLARTFRFSGASGKTGLIDAVDRADGSNLAVGLDKNGRLAIYIAGNDFLHFGRDVVIFCRRNEVAKRNARIERTDRNFEIAAARLRRLVAGRGLRFRTDQQGGKVGGGNFNAVHDKLRHEHGAIDDQHLAAIGQVDDQVAADHMHVAELDTRRQRHDAIGPGHDLLRIGLDDGRSLADVDGQRCGVAVPLVVGERVCEMVARIFGRSRLREIIIIALGIDAEAAEFTGNLQLSAGKARVLPACASNGGDMAAGRRIGAGRTRLRALASDEVASRRGTCAGCYRIRIVASVRLGTLGNCARLGSIFVPHDHLLPCATAGKMPRRVNQWGREPVRLTSIG